MRRLASGLAVAVIVAVSASAHADDKDVIEYRQHIMKTMGEQAAAMGMILQQKAPAENFATHARILATTAAMAKKAYEPKAVGGEAKPEVWTQWSEFAERLDTLAAATADLAKTAEEGGVAAAGPKVRAALTCKGCHDNYRDRNK